MIQSATPRRSSSLVRALRRAARAAELEFTLVTEEEKPWATATFAGTLHRLVLATDPALAAWLAGLPEAELDLRDEVVIELAVEPPATIVALVLRIDTPTRC